MYFSTSNTRGRRPTHPSSIPVTHGQWAETHLHFAAKIGELEFVAKEFETGGVFARKLGISSVRFSSCDTINEQEKDGKSDLGCDDVSSSTCEQDRVGFENIASQHELLSEKRERLSSENEVGCTYIDAAMSRSNEVSDSHVDRNFDGRY
jgi:hypothetical protein